MKPHKHALLIKAWADGAVIQERSKEYEDSDDWTEWEDFDGYWGEHEDWEFRIKPESVNSDDYLALHKALIQAHLDVEYWKMKATKSMEISCTQ